MIEIINPGWLSMVVDGGRYGWGHIGVPPSSALDHFAYQALNYLLGNRPDSPAIEVLGPGFALRFGMDLWVAVTGARVKAFVDDQPVAGWTSFEVKKGALLRIREVVEGFRYYVGFSGPPAIEKVIGSFSTNLECGFGGYGGRSFLKGDRIDLMTHRRPEARLIPEGCIPPMGPPHVLRVIEGTEMDFFSPESIKRFFEEKESGYLVSGQSNRNGIRLEGEPLNFRKGVEKSIISEGILPGTLQIPGDGCPIITLYERTIGGYARLGFIAKVDHDRLAHLKPQDPVVFERISLEEAEDLWKEKQKREFLIRQ
jgi:biotin-dependent carboxylase-like uncharacterized protein